MVETKNTILIVVELFQELGKNTQYYNNRFPYSFYHLRYYWMLGAGALGRPRGMEWEGRKEEGSGWGTHVYLWRIM